MELTGVGAHWQGKFAEPLVRRINQLREVSGETIMSSLGFWGRIRAEWRGLRKGSLGYEKGGKRW